MSEPIFIREYTVDYGHIDSRGVSRPSAIVDFMQDAATLHADQLGLSREAMLEVGAFWVLSRLKCHLDRPLQPYEVVTVHTWPRAIKGPLFYRDFHFFAGGEQIGWAVTAWALVDVKTRRLLRPKTVVPSMPMLVQDLEETLGKLPAAETVPVSTRTVGYSDVDVNRHLNNVKALDIASDLFGLESKPELFVSDLCVNYFSESSCGSVLTLSRGTTDTGSTIVTASEEDTPRFECEILFSSFYSRT